MEQLYHIIALCEVTCAISFSINLVDIKHFLKLRAVESRSSKKDSYWSSCIFIIIIIITIIYQKHYDTSILNTHIHIRNPFEPSDVHVYLDLILHLMPDVLP